MKIRRKLSWMLIGAVTGVAACASSPPKPLQADAQPPKGTPPNPATAGPAAGSAVEPPGAMETPAAERAGSVALAFVIDRSGSMTGQSMVNAKAACLAGTAVLEPTDLVSLIAFDSAADVELAFTPVENQDHVEKSVNRMQPGGGTELLPALELAGASFESVEATVKRVLVLTDGRFPTAGLKRAVLAMRDDGVEVAFVGLGDVDAELLEELGELGRGGFFKVDSPQELTQMFEQQAASLRQLASTH